MAGNDEDSGWEMRAPTALGAQTVPEGGTRDGTREENEWMRGRWDEFGSEQGKGTGDGADHRPEGGQVGRGI